LQQARLVIFIAQPQTLALSSSQLNISFTYDRYKLRWVTLCEQQLISLELFFMELLHQLPDLRESPMPQEREIVKEVTLLGDVFVIHSLDELIIIRGIHHCEVAISHTTNSSCSRILADDCQFTKSVTF